ncbi:MAG: PLP-dependent transferase, partial [Lewinella sp.]|nr:PLP-dependent transferase [Lewinella sp.]
NGHANTISGAVLGMDAGLMRTKVYAALKLLGTNANSWDAWLVHNGMKTLALRMERHCDNAQALAEFLEQHPKVARVNYLSLPSHPDHELAKRQMRRFGGMLSFELKGGLAAAHAFINRLELCTLAPTLGDVDTLVMHPVSMSHMNVPKEIREAAGITDGLVRISVGIEDAADLIGDVGGALEG